MYKKHSIRIIISIIVITIIILNTTNICYADVTDYIPDWISYVVDTSQTIIGYDGTNQAYNDYISNSQQSSNIGAIVQALELMRPDPIIQELFPLTKPVDVLINDTQSVYDGKFRAAYVNRDFVNRLYTNVNGYPGRSDMYKSLSDYGLTTTDNIDYNNNIHVVDTWLTINSNPYTPDAGYDGYYNIGQAKSYNGISIMYGANTPPCMYVPSGHNVYQNSLRIPDNAFYFLVDNNLLYYFPFNSNNNFATLTPFIYYYSNVSTDVLLYEDIYNPYKGSNGRWVGNESNQYQASYCVNGVLSYIPRGSDSLTAVQKLETMVGISIDETVPDLIPPSDIPYDNSGNVIIMIPIDNNNDVTYQDIQYISPATYKQYYDDGDITTNNYTYNNDKQYINDTIINYYNYITNNNGSSYDDTTLLNKLDIIIDKLTGIFNAIKNIGDSDDSDVDIFSSNPIYISFGDCITDNIHISSDIDNIMTNLDVDTEKDIQDYVSSYASHDGTDSDIVDNGFITNVCGNVTINTTWYEPYRIRVRNVLKILCWIFGVVSSWSIIKSVFGIQTNNI